LGARRRDLLQLERALNDRGIVRIAGVDEAGRGCLAGPVFAAAVILPVGLFLPEVDDSKKLSPIKREELYQAITEVAVAWGVAAISPDVIDSVNIHHASLEAMRQAVAQLSPPPEFLLVDGRFPVPLLVPQRPIIRGDSSSQVIAAASILAKVSRDRWMWDAASEYPAFGFERHKGYGTPAHREAIRRLGPTPLHRRSFRLSARVTS